MRTTLDIDDRLLAQAKSEAVRLRTTLTRLIEEGLAMRLRPVASAPVPTIPPLPVYHGRGGLAPGIDGRSNRALFDAMDDERATLR